MDSEISPRMSIEQTSVPVEPDVAAYAEQAAALLGLPLAAEHRPGVVANLTQLRAIAGPLMSFALADPVEPAPVFVP